MLLNTLLAVGQWMADDAHVYFALPLLEVVPVD